MQLGSLIILMLWFSSMTLAQEQQRPSQRSFETVMAKIKERKDARNIMQQKMQQPEDKLIQNNDPGNAVINMQGKGYNEWKQALAATTTTATVFTLKLLSPRAFKVPGVPKTE